MSKEPTIKIGGIELTKKQLEENKKKAKEFAEIKKIEEPNSPFIKILKKTTPNLQDVYDVYKKWLYVSDDKRIDVVLATVLTREIKGTKLWLLLVGNSGDWKSEQIQALDDNGITTKIVKNFTSKSLVPGMLKFKGKLITPLAEKLRGKVMLIPEMAQMLQLSAMEKGEVWAQLRDLYDGYAGKQSGTGMDVLYQDLNVTFIGGSTPAIDSQILIHQSLGSRELIWRTSEEDILDDEQIMNKIMDNEKYEEDMRKELKEITNNFIIHSKYNPEFKIKKKELEIIKIYVNYLRFMRAPAECDSFTGELLNPAHPEKPTRLLKQFIRMFTALKSLDSNYKSKRALRVIEKLMYSSSFQNRMKLFEYLLKNNKEEKTLSNLAKIIRVGKKTAYRELNVLWSLNLIKRRDQIVEMFGKDVEKHFWIINEKSPFVKHIMDLRGLS